MGVQFKSNAIESNFGFMNEWMVQRSTEPKILLAVLLEVHHEQILKLSKEVVTMELVHGTSNASKHPPNNASNVPLSLFVN